MSLVRLSVSDTVVPMLLRLPEDVRLVAAETETYGGGDAVVVLTLDMPGAPPGAERVDLTYSRQGDMPDPVTLDGIRWIGADGKEIRTEPEDAEEP